MLDHCTYDKIKLIHELCSIVWFIEKHAKKNAKNIENFEYHDQLEKISQDLEKHIKLLKNALLKE